MSLANFDLRPGMIVPVLYLTHLLNFLGPWGIDCGDPNQHDVPWGKCVLSVQCDAESRVYRGDSFCGRTSFVCCAVMLTDTEWDNAPLDNLSFEDSGLTTDSQEKKETAAKKSQIKQHRIDTADIKMRHKKKERIRNVKRMILKITSVMHRLLTKMFANNTRKRLKAIKKYRNIVKQLKEEYLNDKRQTLILHESFVQKVDENMYKSLQQVMDTNVKFVQNSTFAKIVSERKTNTDEEKMLLEAYPELEQAIRANHKAAAPEPQLEPETAPSRRSMPNNHFAYDVEYGFLYY